MKLFLIVIITFLSLNLLCGVMQIFSNSSVRELKIKEAEEIVKLYEIRLCNEKIKSLSDKLKTDTAKELFEDIQDAYNDGSVSEKTYRTAKLSYELCKLEEKIKNEQEIKEQLEIAKIRLKMSEFGIFVYNGQKP